LKSDEGILRRRTVVGGGGVEGGREEGREGREEGAPFPVGPVAREEKEPVAVALPLREGRGGFPLLLGAAAAAAAGAGAGGVVLLRERASACWVK